MNQEHVGKRITWGRPPMTGTIAALVPAGSSIDAIARGKRLQGVPRFVEDRAGHDRYLVRGDAAGRRKAQWWAPRAEEVEAALAGAETGAPRSYPVRGPLAFLAVGQERLEDVCAIARAGWGPAFATDLARRPAFTLQLEILHRKAWPDDLSALRVGLAWRAYRAWRREQVQRRADDEDLATAEGEHLRSLASEAGVPVAWPHEDDETLRVKVRAAREGQVQP